MNRRIVDNKGEQILNTLQNIHCTTCIHQHARDGYASICCPLDGIRKRLAYRKNTFLELMVCSDMSKTTKLFRDDVDAIMYGSKTLISIAESTRKSVINETSQRVNRVIHNLKSINAHAIQELYTLVPQNQLLKNVKENPKIVENIIKSNTRLAAVTFFRMAKYNMSIKAEFSIYEKLLLGDVRLNVQEHNIRDVVMIVLYMFFGDFSAKNVYIEVEDFYEKISFDFESFQIAIYHIIENAAKFIAPKTNAKISFRIEKSNVLVIFEMKSLYIQPGEEDEIFNEGYSGEIAKKVDMAGKGIGMYRARRLIELNNGTITVEPGEFPENIKNIDYANNRFIITLPLHKRV